MGHYVILGNFTDQGIRNIKETTKRAAAFRDLAGKMGAKIKDIYWTLGRYDVVLTMEAANDEAMAALLLKVGALGNLKSETLRAFDEEEVNELLSKI